MFCFKCGTALAETATVCPQCGTPIQSTPPAAPPPRPAGLQQPPQPANTGAIRGSQAALPPRMGALQSQTQQPGPAVLHAPYTGPQETDGKAVGSLILGILAIFPLWLLAGIPAVILGHVSRSSIRKSMGRLKGDGVALAGLIMGYISIASFPLILIIAAIAIPSLVRAKLMANESGALSTVRTLATAQIMYSTTYPDSGYAPSLAALGPGEPPISCSDAAKINADHACLADLSLACSSGGWCAKNGYKYNLSAICKPDEKTGHDVCSDYVITATPTSQGTGRKTYCTTNDGIIRSKFVTVFDPLGSVEECQTWPEL